MINKLKKKNEEKKSPTGERQETFKRCAKDLPHDRLSPQVSQPSWAPGRCACERVRWERCAHADRESRGSPAASSLSADVCWTDAQSEPTGLSYSSLPPHWLDNDGRMAGGVEGGLRRGWRLLCWAWATSGAVWSCCKMRFVCVASFVVFILFTLFVTAEARDTAQAQQRRCVKVAVAILRYFV